MVHVGIGCEGAIEVFHIDSIIVVLIRWRRGRFVLLRIGLRIRTVLFRIPISRPGIVVRGFPHCGNGQGECL